MIGYTKPNWDVRDRIDQIYAEREENGMKFSDIGKKHRISSTRARQIYNVEAAKRARYKELPEDVTEAFIKDLPLSIRTLNCLVNGFSFEAKVKDVVGTPRNILLKIPHCGIVCVSEWNTFCIKHGLETSK